MELHLAVPARLEASAFWSTLGGPSSATTHVAVPSNRQSSSTVVHPGHSESLTGATRDLTQHLGPLCVASVLSRTRGHLLPQ